MALREKYRSARVLVLRAIGDGAFTSEDLAEALGMHRRYINRVLEYLASAEANPRGREVYVKDWHKIIREKSGKFYVAKWAQGNERNKRMPSNSKAERNRQYNRRKRALEAAAIKHAKLEAVMRALVTPPPAPEPTEPAGLFVEARALILQILERDPRGRGAAFIAKELGYTLQHANRVLRYLNDPERNPRGRQVHIVRWFNAAFKVGGEYAAVWKLGDAENAPHPRNRRKNNACVG